MKNDRKEVKMAEVTLNIEIELCGYRGRITYLRAREAYPPWLPEDTLYVNVEFDEPYPESIISTAISIPAKEYSREKLLEVVKKEGEKQVAETLAKHRKKREDSERRQERREELDALAKRMEGLLEG